jgi:hypothetical protein
MGVRISRVIQQRGTPLVSGRLLVEVPEWHQVAEVIDAARGQGAQVVLVTQANH